MSSKVQAAISNAMAVNHQRKKEFQEQQELFFKEVTSLRNAGENMNDEHIARTLGVNLEHIVHKRKENEEKLASVLKNVRSRLKPLTEKKYFHKHHVSPPPSNDEPINFPLCLFPADRCELDDADWIANKCRAEDASLFLDNSSRGVGGEFGVMAYPEIPPRTGSLWYGFMPPSGGTLAIVAEILVTGEMVAKAQNHYDQYDIYSYLLRLLHLSISEADARLDFRLRVYQSGRLILNNVMTAASIHADPGQTRWLNFRDDLFVMTAFAQILEIEPVVIQFSAELFAFGRSHNGNAELSFGDHLGLFEDALERGIRVPELCLNLTPTTIL